MWQEHIAIAVHRTAISLKQIELKVAIDIRHGDVHLRICKINSKARARPAAKRDEIPGQLPSIWSEGVTEPALRVKCVRVGKNSFVMRDGVVVHTDDGSWRHDVRFVGEGDFVGDPGGSLGDAVG